ncbi:hypothetical protein [Chromohalobacter israelensis]|uniref:hypothetical protein n=1 Tax=Chromohalobacter israelensis TaxID=141390 RepID=UPI001CC790E1|nr:hypothetical protein [Chromohalobacter salexigens]MBZ5876773.1 hypothetical protein [Chromohalobacter salexigens]
MKVAQDEPCKLYYSNPDKVRGARVTRDMMVRLCSALGKAFDEEDTLKFIGNTRIPNERELYGLFVKALIMGFRSKCGESEIGHVATEVQVARESEGENGKGRVDVIFDYRRTSFLVELKVIRASANARFLEEEDSPTLRLVRPWRKAVKQLRELDTTSLGKALKKKIVKLPMAIYLHIDSKKLQDQTPEWQDLSVTIHHNILTHLEACNHDNEAEGHHFSYYHSLERPVMTSKRRDSLVEGIPSVGFYGFTIIAGMPGEE